MSKLKITMAFASIAICLLCCGTAPKNPSSANVESKSSGLELRFVAKGKKVIPLVYTIGKLTTTDIKPPNLIITNAGSASVHLSSIEVICLAKGMEMYRAVVPGDVIEEFLQNEASKMAAIFSDKEIGKIKRDSLAILFGDFEFIEHMTDSESIAPEYSAVIPLSDFLHITYTGRYPLDSMRIVVTILSEQGESQGQMDVELTHYNNKGKYVFPLSGAGILVVGMAANIVQHRKPISQEFAFDALVIRQLESGVMSTSKDPVTRLEDYFVFGDDVRAVGAGTVVVANDGFPEDRMRNPSAYSEDFFQQLVGELLPILDFATIVVGNHIIIDHGNGEFSLYAHLSEGTLTKNVGDTVSRGEAIAHVGNTGHSTEPHLHFQLMDSSDIFRANSLPIMFEDVTPQVMNSNLVAANNFVSGDYILLDDLLKEIDESEK